MMIHEDPRENTREINDGPHKPKDREKEIKSEKENTEESYRYTDWASF